MSYEFLTKRRGIALALAAFACSALSPILSAQEWVETTVFSGFNGGDHAGRELALDGDTLAFGIFTFSGVYSKQGKVEIYRRDDQGTPNDRLDDSWILESELFPSDAGDGDRFGQSLCLQGDTLFVASPQDDDAGTDAGAIYQFERVNGVWIEVRKFTALDTTDGDWFGIETKIEGNLLLVGATFDDHAAGSNAGSAYVFRFDGTGWNEEAKLTSVHGRTEDLFGRDVHVQGDEIFVSTVQREGLGADFGTIHVFGFDSTMGWIEKQIFTGSDTVDGDNFGFEFEVHGDRLVAAAFNDNASQGSVYVYVRDDNGTPGDVLDDLWVEQAKIVASDGLPGDRFGRGLEIGDTQIFVGTWGSSVSVPDSGSVYVFDLDDNGTPSNLLDDTWSETDEIEASDAFEGARFGTMLHLNDGTLIVGDPEYGGAGNARGQVYVFELTDPVTPGPTSRVVTVDSSSDDAFAYDPSGSLQNQIDLASGNSDSRGTTVDAAGNRWVIDNDDYVYVYDPTGTNIGSWKANGLSRPEGIATDGTHLWIVDRGYDRVFCFANAASRTSGSAAASSYFSLRSGNTNPYGIHTDGSTIWVVNAAKQVDRVYVYNLSGASLGYWNLAGSNSNPRGVSVDGAGNLWTVDSSSDSIFVYEAAAGRTSGSQGAAESWALDSANSNPQGVAITPAGS